MYRVESLSRAFTQNLLHLGQQTRSFSLCLLGEARTTAADVTCLAVSICPMTSFARRGLNRGEIGDYNEDANYPGGRVPAAEEGAESQEHGGSGTGQAGGYTGSIARMRSQGTQLTGEGSSERCKRCDSTGTRLPPKALGTDSLLTSWLFAEFSAGEMEKIVQSCTASTVGGCTRRHHWGGGIHINGRLMADAP